MKKIFLLFLSFVILFCGCAREENPITAETTQPHKAETEEESFTGIWLTYSELSVKGKSYTEETYRKHIAELFSSFREKKINNVFVIPSNVNIDCVNNYAYEEVSANAYSTVTIKRISDNVHPVSAGYQQCADAIYAALKAFY